MTRHSSAQTRLAFRPEELAGVRVLDPDVELPRRAWRPLGPVTRDAAPHWPQVAWVASVASVDARAHLDADERIPAELVTVAVGAVSTTPGHPQASLGVVRRERLLLHGMGIPITIEANDPWGGSGVRYRGVNAGGVTPQAFQIAREHSQERLEVDLANDLLGIDPKPLVLLAGSTEGAWPPRGTVAWRCDLGPVNDLSRLTSFLGTLERGQRSPLMRVEASPWSWYRWYVALADPVGGPPRAVRLTRFEASAGVLDEARALADWTSAWAPGFAAHTSCTAQCQTAPAVALRHALARELERSRPGGGNCW